MLISNCLVTCLRGIESKKEILAIIKTLRKGKPTVILIDSNGGKVKLGFQLCAAIRKNGRVFGIVIGTCNSMAIAVLQACVKRAMLPHATMLFHSIGETRHLECLNLRISKIKKYKEKMLVVQLRYEKYVAKRAEMELEDVRKLCKHGVEVDAKKAYKLGLVDTILNPQLGF